MGGTTTAEPRTFSEDEMTAIIADRVARETSDLQTSLSDLQSELEATKNKLDAEISAREAAEQKAQTVQTEFDTFKSELQAREVAEQRKDERIKAVREAAAHLKDEFFQDEERITRLVAMDDDTFNGYLADLKVAGASAPETSPTPPRETAMSGAPAAPAAGSQAAAASAFFLRGFSGQEG